jgi:hypothetical protein
MGWNFGCTIVEFDFHSVVEKLLEPERRQFVTGAETPEEARSKAQNDAGIVALEALGVSSAPEDAPISFSDATSRYFDDYAAGTFDGKTVFVGRYFGLDQDSPSLAAAYARMSAECGAVFAFWFNDASDSYMFSVFRGGSRIRFFTSGPGLDDNDGARMSCEPEGIIHGHDHLMAVLEAVAGRAFFDMLELPLERFSAC